MYDISCSHRVAHDHQRVDSLLISAMHWRFLVLCVSLLKTVNAADLAPCTGEDDAGYYDLSPLKAK